MFTIVSLFFCLILFSACSQSTDETSMDQKSRVTVDFSAFQVEVEDMSRNSRAALSTAATRLSFAVFKSDGTLVENAIHQTSTDDGFGSLAVELYPGTYQMVAIAHNGSDNAVITSTTSGTLPGSTITDTFTKVQSLTVESNKDCSFSMNLERITSAFILKLNDTPPANVKEIKVVINTNGFLLSQVTPSTLDIDLSSGWAAKSWKFIHTIPAADVSKNIPFYFIGTISPASVNIKATAYDTEDKEIISHTLDNVSLVPNYKTVATGTFFQSSGNGIFTVNSTWFENNIEY